MSKTRTTDKINTITACFSGSGVQADAYFVDDNFMRKYELKISDSDSKIYTPFDTLEILNDATVTFKFICHGMQEDPNIELKLNGAAIQVEELMYDDCFDPESDDEETCLLMHCIENCDQDFMVPKDRHLLIKITEYDYGKLISEIKTTENKVKLKDFLLGVRDLDTSSNLSEATYMTGFLNGAEYDILNLQYKGASAQFDLNFSGVCGGGLYLVKPNEKGVWCDYSEIQTLHNEE